MPVRVDLGALALFVRYLTLLPDGRYRYDRRVPRDVAKAFGRPMIRESLKTKDEKQAVVAVTKLNHRYELQWEAIRKCADANVPTHDLTHSALGILDFLGLKPGEGSKKLSVHPLAREQAIETLDDYLCRNVPNYEDIRHDPQSEDWMLRDALPPVLQVASDLFFKESTKQNALYLSDAVTLYLNSSEKGALKRFQAPVQQAYSKAVSVFGNLPLGSIGRTEANNLRDHMITEGAKKNTIKRRLGTLRTVFQHAIDEHALSLANPFDRIQLRKKNDDADKRESFTHEELVDIARACRELNDDRRHIIAMLLETGARLSEILGLRVQDLHLDAEIPYFDIVSDEKAGRTVKTQFSERRVPLVGLALWAAKEAKSSIKSGWLFPRYAENGNIKGNAASAALNKWLKTRRTGNKPIHSFRHTMKTRLLAVGIPEDVLLTLGGWGSRTTARTYGEPHPVSVTVQWLQKVALSERLS
jgi:integrase